MATIASKVYTIFVIASILAITKARVVYEVNSCSHFGAWQRGCAGSGTVACDDSYLSDAYCISKCYNNVCSRSEDAARDYKKYICETYGIAADYIRGSNGELDLAIHRLKDPDCASYDNTFDFVPTGKLY